MRKKSTEAEAKLSYNLDPGQFDTWPDFSHARAHLDASEPRAGLRTLSLQRVPLVELFLQYLICLLEIQHHLNAGEIEAVIQESGNCPEPLEVVLAVEASPAVTASGSEESSGLVETQVLWSVSDQARSHRYAVDTSGRIGLCLSNHQISPIIGVDTLSFWHKIYGGYNR